MDWFTKMNAAIDYIENNLTSEKFKWDDELFKVLSTMQKRFYSEWLPTAGYDRADSANFEIYGGTNEYGYIELWFPVVKKTSL